MYTVHKRSLTLANITAIFVYMRVIMHIFELLNAQKSSNNETHTRTDTHTHTHTIIKHICKDHKIALQEKIS